MKALNAAQEARIAIDRARRRHDREALLASTGHRPLAAYTHAVAARRLRRYGPSETIVVREIGL